MFKVRFNPRNTDKTAYIREGTEIDPNLCGCCDRCYNPYY